MQPPNSPSEILKLAIVGTGNRAQAHLQTIAKLTDMYRLVAVCDLVAERAAETAARYGVDAYSDVETMLNQAGPDVVLVTVPPEYHHTVACLAASHGAHVLSETPIAITLPYADQMIQAAQQNGVQLEVAENVWRRPQERLKRILIDNGVIGDVRTLRLWYRSGSYHGINAIRLLAGSEVTRVVGTARVTTASPEKRFVDPYLFRVLGPATETPAPLGQETSQVAWELGIVEFANGAVATYEFPFTSRPKGNWWEVQGAAGCILGDQVFVAGHPEPYSIVTEKRAVDGVQVIHTARLAGNDEYAGLVWENPHIRYKPENEDDIARMDQLVSIYRAATEGIAPEYGALGGRKDIEVLVAVRESARRGGHPIDVPIADVTGYEERLLDHYGAGA